jgi:hypothetical protein
MPSTIGIVEGKNIYGFTLGGMVGQEFFKPYAMIFDCVGMKILLSK